MLRLAATGLLTAIAVAGLSACSLNGSAHPAAAVSDASASSTVTASATPTATATPVSGSATGSPIGGQANTGPGRSVVVGGSAPGRSTTGGTTSGGTTSGGTGTGGSSGGSGGGAPAAPSPKVVDFHVAKAPLCPVSAKSTDAPFSATGDQNVTIAWSVTGASGAALSVDQPGTYGAYNPDLPANGSLQLPFLCTPNQTVSHTYTIFPAGAHGVSKSITVSAHSDG